MRLYGPSSCSQVATASPSESTPTWGLLALSPAADRVWVVPTVPPAVRGRACTRLLAPSKRSHTTTALPDPSTPTFGPPAGAPGSDRVWVALTAPPALRARAWIRELRPSERCHTTRASPEEESTATWGLNAL